MYNCENINSAHDAKLYTVALNKNDQTEFSRQSQWHNIHYTKYDGLGFITADSMTF